MKQYYGNSNMNDNQSSCKKENNESLMSKHNKIYFYKSINDESICELNNLIIEKTEESILIQTRFSLEKAPPIHLHIQSYGGYVFSGYSGMESIRNNKVPIYTYVDGIAASAATFLSIVGDKRFIYKDACILIHQISGYSWGTYENFKDEMKNMDLLMNNLKNLYHQYCNFDDKILDELLKHDIYLSSKECLKYNLVDEII